MSSKSWSCIPPSYEKGHDFPMRFSSAWRGIQPIDLLVGLILFNIFFITVGLRQFRRKALT